MNLLAVAIIVILFQSALFSLGYTTACDAIEWQKRGEDDGNGKKKNVHNFDLNVEYVPSSPSSHDDSIQAIQQTIQSKYMSQKNKHEYLFQPRKEPSEYKQDKHNIFQRDYAQYLRESAKNKVELILIQKRKNEAARRIRKANDPIFIKKVEESRRKHNEKLSQARKRVNLGIATKLEKERIFRRRKADNRKKQISRARKKAKLKESQNDNRNGE